MRRTRDSDQVTNSTLGARWDVLVIGGGNAGLVAAISARHLGRRVLVLERAPVGLRGGNTRHAINIRCVHRTAGAYNTGSYLNDDFLSDLHTVAGAQTDAELAALTVMESESVPQWASDHGVHWQPLSSAARQLGRTNRLVLGGGKALVNAYHAKLAQMGVKVLYNAVTQDLLIDGDRCTGAVVDVEGRACELAARAVVCASGGCAADQDWLRQQWGASAANCHVRGTGYNDGTVLRALYAHGAAPAGQARSFHAVPVDARSPRFDGGIATRIDSIPFSILLDRSGRRFCDEGDSLPKRYGAWGQALAGLPGQTAYSIWDAKVNGAFRPPMCRPLQATSIASLARMLGLDQRTVCRTVASYNASITGTGTGTFDPSRKDGLCTIGLHPPKSNWAQRIDQPPFYAVAIRPGVTFANLGAAVTAQANVKRVDGTVFPNVFAAGEIMAGNILPTGYLAGLGLTIATVWGRIAGRAAGAAASVDA